MTLEKNQIVSGFYNWINCDDANKDVDRNKINGVGITSLEKWKDAKLNTIALIGRFEIPILLYIRQFIKIKNINDKPTNNGFLNENIVKFKSVKIN